MAVDTARPGVQQGSRGVPGTLFAAIHGELTPRPDREPVTDRDPYIQFHDRSRVMGWLDVLWDMNDAGREHPLAGPSLVAWFQVGVGAVPGSRSLPVQPFLSCAGDVTARLGDLRLQTVQVLLPAQSLDTSARPDIARMPSVAAAAWFDDVRSWTPVHVTVDSGQDPAVRHAAQHLHQSVVDFAHDVFRCESRIEHDPAPPPLPEAVWVDPPRHRVSFRGTLVEWSLDVVGWLGAFIADVAARRGAGVPLLLTVSRSTPS
ncbi:hypothetical protein ACWEOE_00365 [Amycolatopsis sp. NPDC004368]